MTNQKPFERLSLLITDDVLSEDGETNEEEP